MPAPQSVEELLGLIRKSNLLESAKLDAFLTTQPGGFASPSVLCQKLRANGFLTPFQAEQLLKGKHKGFFLGKYKILDRIGLGGMGQVFLAEHVSMRRRVALKVMPPDRAENQYSRERFLREARAAGQLDHPNLVRAFDVDVENDVIFLVMEFVDGASFQEIVTRTGPMSSDRTGHYLWQAANGLDYLHHRGLIHRDIKPANLLVDRQGVVKILDLGLVRSEVEDDNLTRGEGVKILGTADYLSPEQAIDCSRVDVRTDIYSLGATAYFMLTGKPPFESEKVAQKLLAHQLKPITPVHVVNPAVSPDLSAIITKMLAKKAEDRYQTPQELAAALDAWATKRVPLPSEQEIPAILGGAVGCASTISLSDPRSTIRTGGSSVSLSGTSSSASGSALRYTADSKAMAAVRAGSDSGKAAAALLQTPAITPMPKPIPTPIPAPKAAATAPIDSPPCADQPAPPPLPAAITHQTGAKKSATTERPKLDLNFIMPIELSKAAAPKPENAPTSLRYRLIIGVALTLAIAIGVWNFFLINGMANAQSTVSQTDTKELNTK